MVIFNTDNRHHDAFLRHLLLMCHLENQNIRGYHLSMKMYFVTKIALTYCEKKCSSHQEKLLKFKAEGQEFSKNLGSLFRTIYYKQ